ncbi:MAG: hypothetical protein A2270_06785 [Elusimicrobia bacterium RIFOXYA12_FULL_51_18]|nr:MAG: hypothetical protein A2270_06785 [Elusimicrobia bacterium RIFOXYA12_FULL_51_18]OGS30631.1 MAG: hypothetical protein A2218_06100 [Elusimicrobia bacterium RIFOXYA2_FULL_53_38]
MVKRTAILFLALGLTPLVPVYSGNGTDAVPFMKVDTGARAAGMGGAFAAVADDASAIFHNPAAMTLADRKGIMFSHAEWLEGIRNECISYVHTSGTDWTFGAGASMLFSGSMKKYDRNGGEAGNFTENEGFISLGAAKNLGDKLSGGLGIKTIYQKAGEESDSAYAADAGLLYHYGKWRFVLGMENIGTKLKLYRNKFDLPAAYKTALAWRVLDPAWITIQLTNRPIGGLSAAMGVEYKLAIRKEDSVYARAGYVSGPGSAAGSGIALGLGIGNTGFNLDYAFTPFGDLGNVHRLSLSAKFGERTKTLRAREANLTPYKRHTTKDRGWQNLKK